MTLRSRLDTLRGQAGVEKRREAEEAPASPNIAQRVQRLRPTSRSRPEKPSRRLDPTWLAQTLNAEITAPGVICRERRYPLEERHGRHPLGRLIDAGSAIPEFSQSEGLIFLDTETTGLSGGAGTLAFLLGLGRLEEDTFVFRQYMLTTFAGEAAMLEAATQWMGTEGTLVSYNGKSFDVPLLTARCRMAGIRDEFGKRAHLDLLHVTRRAYGTQWVDCRLATAERQLLSFERTNDLPGAEAPEAWFSFIHAGDPRRLPGVARHNLWDLLTLAALIPALDEAHREPARCKADPLAIARACLKHDREEQALSLLREARDSLNEEGLLEMARIHRRRKEWEQARGIWHSLAEQGCLEAVESLAKYYEHARKDCQRAWDYARRLPDQAEHEHRRQRLLSKLRQTQTRKMPRHRSGRA